MNLRYMMKELYYQRRRTLTSILGLSIGIALLIILNSLSLAYRQAAHVPLKEIGADITVQRSGDVPKELVGPVFPCSAVTINKEEVENLHLRRGGQMRARAGRDTSALHGRHWPYGESTDEVRISHRRSRLFHRQGADVGLHRGADGG